MNDNTRVIRDSVNGVNKYCRVPIRRRRTPVSEMEIVEIEKIKNGLQLDIETFGRVGCLLSDLGFPYFAGKIFSYIDMQQGKEYAFINFVEDKAGGKE